MVNFKKSFAIATSFFSLLMVSTAHADYLQCTRTIYNYSDSAWTLSFQADAQRGHAEVMTSCMSAPNSPRNCEIPPKTAVLVQYYAYRKSGDTFGESSGYVTIKDKRGVARDFRYDLGWFSDCVKIDHYGATGSVTLNEPADGDVKIENNNW